MKAKKYKSLSSGLTLVEIMISMALFSIVALMAVTVTSAVIQMNGETKRWNNEINYQAENVEVGVDTPSATIGDSFNLRITNPDGTVAEDTEIDIYRYNAATIQDDPAVSGGMDEPTKFRYFETRSYDAEAGIIKVVIQNNFAQKCNFTITCDVSGYGARDEFIQGCSGATDKAIIYADGIPSISNYPATQVVLAQFQGIETALDGTVTTPAIAVWLDVSSIFDDARAGTLDTGEKILKVTTTVQDAEGNDKEYLEELTVGELFYEENAALAEGEVIVYVSPENPNNFSVEFN